MRKLLLALAFCFAALPARAQNVTCATRPLGDNSNACASTSFVQQALPTSLPPTGPAGGDLSGTYPNPGVAKVNGNTPGGTCASHTWTNVIDSSGRPTCTQPGVNDLTGLAFSAPQGRVTPIAAHPVPGLSFNAVAASAISNASPTITMPNVSGFPLVVPGMNVYDVTAAKQIGVIQSWVGTTLTLTANAANNGSGSTDTLKISDDLTAATVIYYVPSKAGNAMLLNGAVVTFGTLTLHLDASVQQANKCYRLFVGNNGGTLVYGTGPAFTTCAAGSQDVEAAPVSINASGQFSNTSTMTLTYDTVGGNPQTFSCPAGGCNAVGKILTTTAGQFNAQLQPPSVAGGSNTHFDFCNSFNQWPVTLKSSDSNAVWTYTSATTRDADASASNRVTWMDCDDAQQTEQEYWDSSAGTSTSAAASTIGVCYNADCTAISNFTNGGGAGARFGQAAFNSTAVGSQLIGGLAPYSQGSSIVFSQAGEQGNGSVASQFFNNDFQQVFARPNI